MVIPALVAVSVPVASVHARPYEEIRMRGEISVCANPNALPYASDRPDEPGFQIEPALWPSGSACGCTSIGSCRACAPPRSIATC